MSFRIMFLCASITPKNKFKFHTILNPARYKISSNSLRNVIYLEKYILFLRAFTNSIGTLLCVWKIIFAAAALLFNVIWTTPGAYELIAVYSVLFLVKLSVLNITVVTKYLLDVRMNYTSSCGLVVNNLLLIFVNFKGL